jgi:hypothetical protein
VDLGTPQEGDAVQRADGSFADLRSAQQHALEVDDVATGFGLICSLREYAMRTMRYEVFAWADSASKADGRARDARFPAVTGMRAYGAWVRGDFDAAMELAQVARAAERSAGLAPSGLAERVLANVMSTVGQIGPATTEMARMVEIAEESGVASRMAHAYYMQSVAFSSTGAADEADRLVTKVHELGHRTGSPTDLASAWVAQGFATADDDAAALAAFATADRLAQSAGNRWMSAFARTEASVLLVSNGEVAAGCAGLADVVDIWYRAGEWGQQWHTLARCMIALHAIGRDDVATQVLGAIEAHSTMGGPPVMPRLRTLAFSTRESLVTELGPGRADDERATGAALPVAVLVGRARNALLGRPIDG